MPSRLGGIDESSLELRYWNGSAWVADGITLVERDTVNNRIMVLIEHLTEIAPLAKYRTHLPVIVRD